MFENTKAYSGFSVDDMRRARQFYEGTLGLEVDEENGMLASTSPTAGTSWRIRNRITPRPHSPILNFPVEDIDRAVDDLTGNGIEMVRYQGMNQDEKGIMRDDRPSDRLVPGPGRKRSLSPGGVGIPAQSWPVGPAIEAR